MIHVTHDQGEALALGSRIAVLKEGRIVQSGAPLDVYEHPACRFVGEFIGSPPMSILPCLVEAAGPATRIRIVGCARRDGLDVRRRGPMGRTACATGRTAR